MYATIDKFNTKINNNKIFNSIELFKPYSVLLSLVTFTIHMYLCMYVHTFAPMHIVLRASQVVYTIYTIFKNMRMYIQMYEFPLKNER